MRWVKGGVARVMHHALPGLTVWRGGFLLPATWPLHLLIAARDDDPPRGYSSRCPDERFGFVRHILGRARAQLASVRPLL